MKQFFVALTLLFSLPCFSDTSFVFVVCSYNNEQWIEKNLDSLFSQTYANYRVIYVNDCSTDSTDTAVKNYLAEHNIPENKFLYLHTAQRNYKLHNFYNALHDYCENNEVIVEIDGDDWLANEHVLEILNTLYSTQTIWMTYGGFVSWPQPFKRLKAHAISYEIIKNNNFREFHRKGYIFIALRSFYASLFKMIKKEDLILEDGTFFKEGSDIATMIPMFEMAGERFYQVTDPVYVYNTGTGIHDHQKNKQGQNIISNLVLNKKKYTRLDALPNHSTT